MVCNITFTYSLIILLSLIKGEKHWTYNFKVLSPTEHHFPRRKDRIENLFVKKY